MRYLSICSGIEAASVAWRPLGWEPTAFAEIEPFPCAVLAQHYPRVSNLGDFTKIGAEDVGAIDLLAGGTPCQSFSVAGKRAGLDDPRGNLTIEFARLTDRLRPAWLVWENVPGVLSIDGGRTFGAFLGMLVECGYGVAYRVLDAQFFGVPQRRRRVFVVGHSGDWRPAAAVLLEQSCLYGYPPPRRETRQGTAGTLGSSSSGGGRRTTDVDDHGAYIPEIVNQAMSSKCAKGTSGPAGDETSNLISQTLTAHMYRSGGATAGNNPGVRNCVITNTLRAEGFDTSEDGSGRGVPLLPIPFDTTQITSKGNYSHPKADDPCHPLVSKAHAPAVAFQGAVTRVRRLTPRECERLQGFPDDYTLVDYRGRPAADGPRYKALGNSMAVPVMRWIGERIAQVETLNEK